jgi:hypothetical protein
VVVTGDRGHSRCAATRADRHRAVDAPKNTADEAYSIEVLIQLVV